MTRWLDGTAVADEIKREVERDVARLAAAGLRPGLAVVLVGEDPASQVYVRSKVKTCQALGMYSEKVELPREATTAEVLAVVERLNADPAVHGILVQVPLPPQIKARLVLESVLPSKDVDGFHPVNIGRLVAGNAILKPCTPAGIMELLARNQIALRGRRAVVI